jgi:hypothetical protein
VDLEPRIDWHADFKTGRRWPAEHISRVPIVFGDGSDIKVPWELSRFQHLPVLAAAHRLTGDRRYLEEVGAQLDAWIAANPVEFGPNWACTMDVAIRAANWVAALVLCADASAREPWLERALASLLLHGRFIRRHLEYAEIRGNHYLADIAGLLAVASVFARSREGRRWATWAAGQLVTEMGHQVRADGTDHEASIPYHRLVTEMFLCATHAVDALLPGRLPDDYRASLDAMLGFVGAYTRPRGDAPMIGDNDSGRFLPLDEYGTDYRSHLHVFAQAGGERPHPGGHAAYPDSGFWVMRGGALWAIVRCGDVGLRGRGCHAHNDALSFELGFDGEPLIVDPGTFVYTADPAERNRFRSTASHSTLRIGDGEQNPLRSDLLFVMEDRARPEALAWEPGDDGRATFVGRHRGFGPVHERRLEFDGPGAALTIEDTIHGGDGRPLEWTFPLPPRARAQATRGGATADIGAALLEIAGPGLEFAVEAGWYAPAYGHRERTLYVRARRAGKAGEDRQRITVQARPAAPARHASTFAELS